MNINRKVINVELNNEKMVMALDFESAIYYQENTGTDIFSGMERIRQLDAKCFAYLIASVLRRVDENGDETIVGIEFVNKLDLFRTMEFFMSKMTELMDNSLPTEDEEGSTSKKK